MLPGNLLWYGDFKSTAHSQSQGGKGGGGKGVKTTSFTYQAAVAIGLCEGPIDSVQTVYLNKGETTLAEQGMTLFDGSYSQSAWGYLTTNHPSEALNYRGITYVAAGPLQLGDSEELPNYRFVLRFDINSAIAGKPDADPRDIVNDLLTNAKYGVTGFPPSLIAAMTTYSNYCRAMGLVLSPIMTGDATAKDFFDEMMVATNSEIVWSNGKFDVVPYGDQSVTANGSTYTAPSAPVYGLTDEDFGANQAANSSSSASSGSGDKIVVTRRPQSKQLNAIRVEFLDRANQYDPAIAEAKDDALIAVKLRPSDVKQLHMICDKDAANTCAELMLGREWVSNTYAFTIDAAFILLDPMDIISVTTPAGSRLVLDEQWMRVKEITENSDRSLSIIAEEVLIGTGHRPLYTRQSGLGYVADYFEAPGPVNTPIIFEAPIQIAPTGLEVWVAASGSVPATFGGCEVWVSWDGSNYQFVERQVGPARMGELTNSPAAGSGDPDTGVTVSVDLSESQGVVSSGSTTDVNNLSPLAYVDGELMAFRDASLTSTYNYDLSYLKRGLYGTTRGAHSSGTKFAMLDNQIMAIPYSKDQVGKTIKIKLPAFNLYGQAIESLAACTEYTHVLGGPSIAYEPSSLTATGSFKSIRLNWTNAANVGPEVVEIWRSASSSHGAGAKIGEAAAGTTTYVDENLSTATAYWYWIRYRDRAGGVSAYSPSSSGAGATATTTQTATADYQDASTTTPKLATNAATLLGDVTGSTTQAAASEAWTALCSFTGSFYGAGAIAQFFIEIRNDDAGQHKYGIRIKYNSTVIYELASSAGFWCAGQGLHMPATVVLEHDPAAGSQTYYLEFASDSTAVYALNPTIVLLEARR
ncbi:MAG: hypothetical protein A3E01_09930 [Gammaproteobacteria bacterium RIFCSPHIGHO2_12_FULL_63_22]|nr:MAG: hypothetical protein A3E01_09930 [Gammaproteobacteria bacterium RIFCSPHIGHO2_12_FULL_63_22]